jgi:uncharacterized repeat protein (TIGR01451 family)
LAPTARLRAEDIQETPTFHKTGRVQVLVEFADVPAARVYGETLRASLAQHLSAEQAKAAAVRAAQNQIRRIVPMQERFLAAVPGALGAREIYRVQKAYNGIALDVDAAGVAALRSLPGVHAVHPLELEYPTNSTSVPFLGVPNVWGNTLGLPQGATGTGVRIGIIDTGIDYIHSDFGGTGLLADYQANNRTSNADGFFPTAKVVGGTDLVGDAYTGANPPVPDPDPMDCNGHGSHVAGTAAGFGVNADGTTYAGPYDGSAPFGSFRVGPGVAPQALLYAIRVFGCTGGTNIVVQAIDWAMDPNGDLDLSDHLDVINMSLGSQFGGGDNSSAVAADNAAAAGVIVVCSAGNSGDTFFIGGGPSAASRAISTAASADSGVAGVVLTINAPAGIAGSYSASAANTFAPTPAPAPTGQTANVVQALDAANASGPLTTDGCTALTNAAAVAGNIAIVDRGTCGFQIKANNAQAAGAIGVIIANNAVGDPSLIVMGATGAVPVTIPSIFISKADRDTIVAQLPGVNATLGAASAADTVASFTSRGPRLSPLAIQLKPDIAAPGVSITSAQTGTTCTAAPGCTGQSDPSGFVPGNLALTISGTSMASPHMAGVMALLLQLHPDWSVEQLKALAMNGALHDVTLGSNGGLPKYGPGRIGSSRVDPSKSAQATVVALNSEDSGLVSVSFETTAVVGTATEVKKVRLINTGTSAATYDLAIDTKVDAPGIAFSLPGGSTVTIPAGDSVEIDVQMDANAALMDHTRETSIPPTQASPAAFNVGTLNRHWMTEEASYLVLSQSGTPKLHLPLYLTSRPASTMSAPATIVTGGAGTGSTTIPLSGTDVCSGTLGAGPVCTGTFPTDEVSLVTPVELQVVSPQAPAVNPVEDLQYAGVAYNAGSNLLYFGVSTWADWTTQVQVSFNIYIDTNEDGTWDTVLFDSNPGTLANAYFASANGMDTPLSLVYNISTGVISPVTFINRSSGAAIDSAVFNNNVRFLVATPASLGLPGGDTTFRYKILTCPGTSPLCEEGNGFHSDEALGPYFYNYGAQGLSFSGVSLAQDLNGATLPVTWNTANMATNGSLGALLLHHHNKPGTRAEVVVLDTAQSADLAITKSVAPANPTLGQNVVFTLTVTNNGPNAAAGVQVSDLLPPGLTYVSDDGGGAYTSGTGLWTVGALANAASATLNITATVEITDQICNLAQITAATPLDTNPANNQSQVCVMAPRSSDVALGMSVSSPTVLVGANVTYTITATNNGTDTAYAVDVNESFPAFPLLNPGSFTASQGSYNPATGLWNLASLAPGASATLDITVAAPNIAGALTDQSTASTTNNDPNNANNTASATTTVLSPANVTATKTVAGTFRVGQTVTYTVTLSNSAAYDQQDNAGHEFTDVLPASLTLVSANASSGTAGTSGNTVNWDGVVPASGSVTITITATINAGTALTTIANQGTVNYDADGNGVTEANRLTDDPGIGGASDPTSFFVLSPATVSATKTVAGTFRVGQTVTYTVTLSNSGPYDQQNNTGNEFTDVLPAGLTLVSASASSGTAVATVATNTVTWNGVVPASGSVTVTIQATINAGTAGTTVSNQGTVSFDADGNGVSEASALTDNPGVAGAADPTSFLVLSPATVTGTMTVSGSYAQGTTVTYTVILTNTNTNPIVKAAQGDNPGNEFVDVLPSQLTLQSASATSGSAVATIPTNTVTWNGSIPAGGSVTITINAVINAGTGGQTITNQGTINFDADGNGTNESSGVTDDPAVTGSTNPTAFAALDITQVPTLNEVGLAALCLLLAGAALLRLRRRAA